MKRVLNRWQLVWRHGREVQYYMPFVKSITFGVINLQSFPNEGALISKKNYKGFMIALRYWFPVERI